MSLRKLIVELKTTQIVLLFAICLAQDQCLANLRGGPAQRGRVSADMMTMIHVIKY